jgi:hypothetical protein
MLLLLSALNTHSIYYVIICQHTSAYVSIRQHTDFYSYKLIRNLTDFLQLQEFSLRNPPVDYSTSAERLSLNSSKAGLS